MTEEAEKSFAEKALDLDHRILATLVFVIISALILRPISIPFPSQLVATANSTMISWIRYRPERLWASC